MDKDFKTRKLHPGFVSIQIIVLKMKGEYIAAGFIIAIMLALSFYALFCVPTILKQRNIVEQEQVEVEVRRITLERETTSLLGLWFDLELEEEFRVSYSLCRGKVGFIRFECIQ